MMRILLYISKTKILQREIMKTEKLKMKICLVGDHGVGKTSLIKRYVYDEFDERYIRTVGTKVSKKRLDLVLPEHDLKIEIDMVIWDIIGQIGFRQLLKKAYFYGASGAMATADCTTKKTLEDLDDWLGDLYTVTSEIPIVIMANKVDLENRISVDEDDVKDLAKAYKSPYHFTSAKTGKNVEKSFGDIAKNVVEKQSKDKGFLNTV